MNQIVICTNPARDHGLAATRKLVDALKTAGLSSVVYSVPELPGADSDDTLRSLMKGARAAVVLGGDGTILRIAHPAAQEEVPLLGINFGSMGFMSLLEKEELLSAVPLLTGEIRRESRMMLDVKVLRQGEIAYEQTALNEAVVRGVSRIVSVGIEADGTPLSRFSGDGVAVSTATGSTAYSMSAGGPIAEPTAQLMIVTPINAHALLSRSMLLSPERRIILRPGELSNRAVYLMVDGNEPFDLMTGDTVLCTRAEMTADFIALDYTSFYDKVSRKMGE